jgi:hypothetical protein
MKMKSQKNEKRVYEFLTQNQVRERLIENREDAVVVTDNKEQKKRQKYRGPEPYNPYYDG